MSKEENKKMEQKQEFVSREKLLEHGVHFGHKTFSWNPEMKPFIHGEKNGTHIINLNKIVATLQHSYNFVEQIAQKGGTFLFVGTSKQSKDTIKENAERVNAYYISERWLGGTLTNFKTIQNSIKRLRYLERLQKSDFVGYTKKEASKLSKELTKLELNLGGIKYMRKLPSAIFVSSIVNENIVIKEAEKFGIPVFGIVDTNANPRLIQFPIVANDDGNKSVAIITTIIADAIASAKGEQKLVVGVEKDDIRVLGLQKNTSVYKNEGNRFKKNYRNFNENNSEEKDEVVKPLKKETQKIVKVEEPKPEVKKEVKPKEEEIVKPVKEETKKQVKVEEPKPEVKKEVKPKKITKEEKEAQDVAKEQEKQKEIIKEIKTKVKQNSSISGINVSVIRGIGIKTTDYLNSKNIFNLSDLLKVVEENRLEEIALGIPGTLNEKAPTKIKRMSKFLDLTKEHINSLK